MINKSSVIYRFKSYHYTEDKFNKYLFNKLENIYADTGKSEVRIESGVRKGKEINDKSKEAEKLDSCFAKNVISGIKKKYRRSSSCSAPWIDHSLWDQIISTDTSDLPSQISSATNVFTSKTSVYEPTPDSRKQFSSEVKSQDLECLQRYTSKSRRLSSISINHFGRAGLSAAKELSIIPQHAKDKFRNFRSPDSSVDVTAKSTNSGFPFFKKKNSSKCISDTKIWLSKFVSNPNYYSIMNNAVYENPTSLFHRVQPTMNDDESASCKIRQVWCVPQRIVSLEHYFFSEVLNRVFEKNRSCQSSIYSSGLTNLEISKKIVRRLRLKLKQDGDECLYSLDYSKYDQTIPNFAIDLFFAIIKDCLNLNPCEDKAFECLRVYLRNTPMCEGDNLYLKTKGILSGCYITNLFDSWFNLTLWHLARNIKDDFSYLSGNEFEKTDLLISLGLNPINKRYSAMDCLGICGDDVIIYCTDALISMHERLCRSLGMKISVGGKYNDPDDDVYFLGRYWDYLNRPFNSYTYMIVHICFRTKFYSKSSVDFDISTDLSLNRILSICGPLVGGYEFVVKYFSNWKPMSDFLKGTNSYTLLKEWPNDGYKKVNRFDAFCWEKY